MLIHVFSSENEGVVSNIEGGEVLERFQFDTECDKTAKEAVHPERSLKKLSKMKSFR